MILMVGAIHLHSQRRSNNRVQNASSSFSREYISIAFDFNIFKRDLFDLFDLFDLEWLIFYGPCDHHFSYGLTLLTPHFPVGNSILKWHRPSIQSVIPYWLSHFARIMDFEIPLIRYFVVLCSDSTKPILSHLIKNLNPSLVRVLNSNIHFFLSFFFFFI